MALDLAAAATAAEYRAAVGRVSTAEDATILALLTTVTRVVERRARVAPGMFGPQTDSLTFTFDAPGGQVLYLRDDSGLQYFLRSVADDGIGIDSELDGTFDGYEVDLDDAWVSGKPANALQFSEPYTAIEILPHVSGAAPLCWPARNRSVRITSTAWGWAAVPGAIKQRVIGITRELIDTQHAGAAWTVDMVEEAADRVPSIRSLMALVEREYSYGVPAL